MIRFALGLLLVLSVTACVQPASHNGLTLAKLFPKSGATLTSADRYADADAAFAQKDYAKAIALYSENQPDPKKDTEALFHYAEALRFTDQAPQAIVQYDRLLAANPQAWYAMEAKALALVEQGQFNQATTLLSDVLQQDATRWRTINALGVINALSGNVKESLEYYTMALEVSNNNPSVMNNIALSVAFSGDIPRGRSMLESALAKLPATDTDKQRKLESNLAMIYGLAGDMDKAQALLEKHLTQAQVLNNLGFYAKLANDKTLAKTYLSKALSSSPVYYERAWNNLKDLDGQG